MNTNLIETKERLREIVKAARKRRIYYADIVEASGKRISYQWIAAFVQGEFDNPGVRTLQALTDALVALDLLPESRDLEGEKSG